jgi:hypothetical protein
MYGFKNKLLEKKDSGQALVEFILFLPLMLIMYTSVVTLGNSINGSINQQKVARGYLFSRLLNNSTSPKPTSRDQSFKNWNSFGMFFIGYAEKKQGNQPISACYALKLPIETSETQCLKYNRSSTTFVRVETAFGICGGTYVKSNNSVSWALASTDSQSLLPASMAGCEIR